MHATATEKLTHKQERAIVALVTEPNIPRAAEVAKVGQRCIYDWLKIDAFKTELRRARREAFTQAIALAQRYAPLAMTTLAKIAADPNAPQHARVSASCDSVEKPSSSMTWPSGSRPLKMPPSWTRRTEASRGHRKPRKATGAIPSPG